MTNWAGAAAIAGIGTAFVGPIDSSTAGFLYPYPYSPPAEGSGDGVIGFIQSWITGISGLPGKYVRPRWQVEPPNIPTDGNVWAAIGITRRVSDTYPVFLHKCDNPGGPGHDQMQRHTFLDVLCSFYDLGINGLADWYAEQTRDNGLVPQNREVLLLNGWGLISMGELIVVPSLAKMRWLYRVDLPIVLRHATVRNYPVRNLLELDATIIRPDGVTISFP